jgi:ribonuclease HI
MAQKLFKFVGFVPVDELHDVREAVFAAGAGTIGDYDKCSWSTGGTGTFRGGAGTNPTIGSAGTFEEVEEVRFETIVPESALAPVVQAFVATHSYEEPAYEVYALHLPVAPAETAAAAPVVEPDEPTQMSMSSNGDGPKQLWFDGGSRGNPGPAAAAYILRDAHGGEILAEGHALGRVTNNVAEYNGLVKGLERALQLGATTLEIYSDSELVVKQLQGAYKVKHPDMKRLYDEAQQHLRKLDKYSVTHVLRGKNAEADALVNQTLDAHA